MSDIGDKVQPSFVEVTTPIPVSEFDADQANETRYGENAAAAMPDAPPPGARSLAREVYGTAGAGGRDLHALVHARADEAERRPGIILLHGGAWIAGEPAHYSHHVRALAGAGFVTAAIEYRLIREASWPANIEDVKCAIRWMRANAERLGVDRDQIVVLGGSAGGHLAAIAALTPGKFEGSGGHDDTSSAVQAAVLSCPPLDVGGVEGFFGEDVAEEFYSLFFGASRDQTAFAAASAFTHVSADAPPFLVLYGDLDPLTPMETMRAFGDALAAVGVPSEFVMWRGRNHGFEGVPADFEEVIERVADFLGRRFNS